MLCANVPPPQAPPSFNELPHALSAEVADDCVLPLCRALAVSPSLRTLRYAHAGLGTSAGVQLGHALAFNHALTDLDLSYNAVGDAGCSTFASALAVNGSLRRLSLAANGIGHIGASALCQVLHAHAAGPGGGSARRAGPGSESDSDGGSGAGSGGGSGSAPVSVLNELSLGSNELDGNAEAALRAAWAAVPWRLPSCLDL
ncbi:hypothetical protein T492DRAFT_861516 [Pavlovales sp. CCMP2436]|nr:hypothetical protein T492DRAFT_861516 [Pavlovales sp. CCMP2436]